MVGQWQRWRGLQPYDIILPVRLTVQPLIDRKIVTEVRGHLIMEYDLVIPMVWFFNALRVVVAPHRSLFLTLRRSSKQHTVSHVLLVSKAIYTFTISFSAGGMRLDVTATVLLLTDLLHQLL